jgi:YidC/Oxa1 family membrane protein insertase
MKLDRNSVIGFVLLALLFFGYFYFTRQGQIELEAKQKRAQDSLARLQPQKNTPLIQLDSTKTDSLARVSAAGQFATTAYGKEEITVVENDIVRISFTNKGGMPKSFELKKYLSKDSSQVKLGSTPFDKLTYRINTGNNNTAETSELFFAGGKTVKNADGSQVVSFELADSTGRSITHEYIIFPNQYMIDWNVKFDRVDQLIGKNSLDLSWQVRAMQQEQDIASEKRETQIDLYEKDGFDYFTMKDGLTEKWEEGAKWISLKQKFFNHTIIAKNGFSYAEMNTTMPHDSTGVVASAIASLRAPIAVGTTATIPFSLYYGPNDFKILKSYKMDLEDMVNLGQGFYAFVKYINRLIVMPVFNLFSGFIKSYGLVIALLTIIIRLVTSPLVYTSYLSGAKMKALKPELDVLKEKLKMISRHSAWNK